MTDPQFAVGDKVRVIGDSQYAGNICPVLKVEPDWITVRVGSKRLTYTMRLRFRREQIEKVKNGRWKRLLEKILLWWLWIKAVMP